MNQVYFMIDELPDLLDQFPNRAAETEVLLVDPRFYNVVYEINPHMSGNIGTVDSALARTQWERLKEIYEGVGYPVNVIDGVSGLPDMVFCANQTFPFLDAQGLRTVVLSNMDSEFRKDEVPQIAEWYRSQGYRIVEQLNPPVGFEGMGDALWHPGHRLMYIGYGFRTHKDALQRAVNCIECSVIGLELVHPHFYHLDTALSMIDEHTALYVPDAFSEVSKNVLKKMFSRLIEVPLQEAQEGFVTNGHCPDGNHFIVHKGNPITRAKVESLGIKVIEVDTSQFMKSGGSVFCMKMMLP